MGGRWPSHPGTGAWSAWALLIVLAMSATAQPAPDGLEVRAGPGVALVMHHPYPDDADPLGFPYEAGVGSFQVRQRHHDPDRDGFDFPSLVADGIVLVEGLPAGDDPERATRAAYEAAIARRATEAPVVLQVFTADLGEGRQAMVQATPRAPLDERLHLWVALVEQPVHYAPPPAISNGVTDHPYTLRAIIDAGALELANGTADGVAQRFALDPAWNEERLFVAAWVQHAAVEGPRFDAHEVVQATMHPWLADHVTRQEQKGVLLEGYSATWCDPCLFGDRAFEAVAATHGLPSGPADAPSSLRYLDVPAAWPVLLVAALVAGALAGRRAWPGARP